MLFKGSHTCLSSCFPRQVSSLPININVTLVFAGESSDNTTDGNANMPGAAVISALTLIYMLHRDLIVKGFTLKRRGLFYSLRNRIWPPIWPSTDFLVSLELLIITAVWTIVIF